MPSGTSIYVVIAVTFFGFIGLAFVLLYPVYRFMRRQERIADDWTPDAVARRTRAPGGDGAATTGPDEPEPREPEGR